MYSLYIFECTLATNIFGSISLIKYENYVALRCLQVLRLQQSYKLYCTMQTLYALLVSRSAFTWFVSIPKYLMPLSTIVFGFIVGKTEVRLRLHPCWVVCWHRLLQPPSWQVVYFLSIFCPNFSPGFTFAGAEAYDLSFFSGFSQPRITQCTPTFF